MIAVDCEGVKLSRFGSITMINIGTHDLVYLIDILKIVNSVFDNGLRTILEDSGIEKLMFDCREDADALFHLYKTKLDGVLDLQILEVNNRAHEYRNGYTKPRSFKHCLELYVKDLSLLNIKLQGQARMKILSAIWEKRPLDVNMLKYASVDILVFLNSMMHFVLIWFIVSGKHPQVGIVTLLDQKTGCSVMAMASYQKA
ncbi:EXD1 [Mytilus coruscus]|uniref:EXD1 n=1 Tax=Mytilus coruscus TaxID=42192 RepID=A0A6J8B2T4_MYTCO|nr:EXD1 [Mytilus coruscus]